MKNILLVDGYSFTRHLVRNKIDACKSIGVVAEAKDLAGAVQSIRQHRIDVIVVDISIPDRNGFETFNDLHQLAPHTPVLIIGGNAQAHHVATFIQLGCKGYLAKDCDDDQLLEAIHVISNGGQCVQPASLYSLMQRYREYQEIPVTLSARELQIFFKLVTGKSIETIARELNISSSTVSVFRSRILRKMHLKNNADLILYAVNHHLVISPPRIS